MKKQNIRYGAVALAAMFAFSSCCWHHHHCGAGWYGGAPGHHMAVHSGGQGFHHGMGHRR